MTFDALFLDEYDGVVLLVAPLTRSRPVAEDVAQEAFASALAQWPRVSGFDRPDLWVRRVALNRAISVARRRGSEQRALERLKHHGLAQVVPVDELVASAAPDRRLWDAVGELPARQAQLVALVYVEGRAIDDAAMILGLRASTARTHLQRARAALSSAIGFPAEGHDHG